MGNIGRSSAGCALCRRRKIKCDESRPSCKRCAQIRKPCPGYPFQVRLQLRDNSAAHDSPLPPPSYRHQTSHSDLDSETKVKTEDDATQESSEKALLSAAETITSPPRYDIHHQSLCFFLNLFCFQASRLYAFPVLDFLPDMIKAAKHGSCIHDAAMAVSRLTLADRYSGKDVRLQTGREYGQALAHTNATIRDTRANIQDETVLAVWLLGLYEMISVVLTHGRTTPDSPSLEEEWSTHLMHVRGAMNLLRMRGMTQFTTARGEKIFRIFKAAIQMRLFILTSVVSTDFDTLEVDIFQEEHEFVPSTTANKATSYFHQVARLLERIKLFLMREKRLRKGDTSSAFDFVKEGESLDKGMTDWSKDEPGWDMMPVRAATKGTMWSLYPSHAKYYFYSFWVFLYWFRYLSARFKLYEGMIELLKAVDSQSTARFVSPLYKYDEQMPVYRQYMRATADDLIGLTAYALGDVTPTGDFNSSVSGHHPRKGFQEINVVAAMQLVLPLKMLQRSEHMMATQRGAVDLAISHIGDGFRRQPVVPV